MSAHPHQARDMAESFGVDARRYDRTRPRYPDELLARIVAESPGPDVLDVGAGTGIVARQLAAAGCRVLGVEVDERMATFARSLGTAVETARFEDWSPAGRTFDAVVSGQAWHWVDPVAGAARAAQALRPGGLLAVFWNVAEPPADLAEAFAAVYRRTLPEVSLLHHTPPAGAGHGPFVESAEDGLARAGYFGEPVRWSFAWTQRYTRDQWLDQVPTSGVLARLSAEELEPALAGVAGAIDEAGGSFVVRYTTVAVAAHRV